MNKADPLFVEFENLSVDQQWQFWAKIRQWERTRGEMLYEVAKQVNFESGLPWTDPRTRKTYYPPKR